MKHLLAFALATGTAVVALSPADAAGGCGRGFHPGPYGQRCFPNGPGGPWVVHRYYPGRGYWYGNRFWWHRHGWHGRWRYY